MRLLQHQDLIRFAQPDQETLAEALKRYRKIIDAHGSPRNWLDYAVREGILRLVLIQHAGKPAFVVWYQVTPEGRLVVDSAQSVSQQAQFSVLVEGVEQLARENSCRVVEFRTLRQGMVRQAAKHGFFPTSIIMSKPIRSYGKS